jgi:hypothetical protein
VGLFLGTEYVGQHERVSAALFVVDGFSKPHTFSIDQKRCPMLG